MPQSSKKMTFYIPMCWVEDNSKLDFLINGIVEKELLIDPTCQIYNLLILLLWKNAKSILLTEPFSLGYYYKFNKF